MKASRVILAAVLSLSLAGCGAGSVIDKVVSSVTTTITNPITPVDIYRVKNVYAASLELANDYRTYCWSKPYRAILADPVAKPICQSRRVVVRSMQSASVNASSAIKVADKFIRDNPTGNAISYVTAAWDSVQSFRSSIPTVK